MPPKAQPHLLGLPAELRIRIFQETLTSAASISLNIAANRQQPALLRTSRQIRREAIPLYYAENTFHFEACRLKGTEIIPFCRLQQKYRKDHRADLSTILCTHRDYWHRGNLSRWLRAYHADPAVVPSPRQDEEFFGRESKNLVVRMFGVCEAMALKPWWKVDQVLQSFFVAVGHLEDLWEMDQEGDEVMDDGDGDESYDEDYDMDDFEEEKT